MSGGGKTVGDYRLIDLIGRGGSAEVYRAARATGDHVAIKVYKADHVQGTQLAERALYQLRALGHPNIIEIFDWFRDDDGNLCIVQELSADGSLGDLLNSEGPLDDQRLRRLATDMAKALQHAHANGVLHRDIKPSNVLIVGDTFKLADFDSSGLLSTQHGATMSGQFSGTPRYMSPEQLSGSALTEASDIFGLGLTLYEASYGTVPGDDIASFVQLVQTRLSEEIQVPAGSLQSLISACLALEPTDRPSSATAVLTRLTGTASFTGPTPPQAPQPPTITPPVEAPGPIQGMTSAESGTAELREARSRPGWVIPFTVAAIVIGLALVAMIWTASTEPDPGSGTRSAPAVFLWLLAGAAVVAVFAFAANQLRKQIPEHDPAVEQQAARVVFGFETKGSLTDSLFAEASSVLARLESADKAFLGVTIHAMIHEFHRSEESSDRQQALLNALDLMDRVQKKLSPWHVRHRDSLATAVNITGGIAGLITAVTGMIT